jgi:hypothetical protein
MAKTQIRQRSMGGLLTSPIVNTGLGLLTAGNQRRAQNRYNRNVDQRQYDLLAGEENRARNAFRMTDEGLRRAEETLANTRSQGVSQANAFGNELTGGYGHRAAGVLGDVNRAGTNLQSGTQGLLSNLGSDYGNIYDLLQNQGAQAAKDINTDFGQREAGALQDLADRGGGGSTVSAAVRGSIGREKSDALARLAESIARLKAGYMQSGAESKAGYT